MTDNIMLDEQAYTGLTTGACDCAERPISRPAANFWLAGPPKARICPLLAHLEPNEERPNVCQVVPPPNVRDGQPRWKTTSTGNWNKPWLCSC
jgi:hypothetical protein